MVKFGQIWSHWSIIRTFVYLFIFGKLKKWFQHWRRRRGFCVFPRTSVTRFVKISKLLWQMFFSILLFQMAKYWKNNLWQILLNVPNHLTLLDDFESTLQSYITSLESYWLENCLEYNSRLVFYNRRAFIRLVTVGHIGSNLEIKKTPNATFLTSWSQKPISEKRSKTLSSEAVRPIMQNYFVTIIWPNFTNVSFI